VDNSFVVLRKPIMGYHRLEAIMAMKWFLLLDLFPLLLLLNEGSVSSVHCFLRYDFKFIAYIIDY
jgi:hypothetical protein